MNNFEAITRIQQQFQKQVDIKSQILTDCNDLSREFFAKTYESKTDGLQRDLKVSKAKHKALVEELEKLTEDVSANNIGDKTLRICSADMDSKDFLDNLMQKMEDVEREESLAEMNMLIHCSVMSAYADAMSKFTTVKSDEIKKMAETSEKMLEELVEEMMPDRFEFEKFINSLSKEEINGILDA